MKISHFGSGIAFLTLFLGSQATNAQPDTAPKRMVPQVIPPQGMAATPKAPRIIATGPGKQVMQDLLDFADLLNSGKIFPEGQKWVYGAKPGLFGANQWARESYPLRMPLNGVSLQISKLTVDKMEADTATATVTHFYALPALPAENGIPEVNMVDVVDMFTRPRTEILQLKLGTLPGVTAKKWQIVPPEWIAPIDTVNAGNNDLSDIFSRVSYALAQKPGFEVTNEKAKVSISRLKQLGLGVLQFVQDYGERYAFAPEYLQEAIFPYVKSKELFLVPNSQESYSFNANLSDKSLNDVKEPSKIVMFYEGTDEKPTFRYDGKAVIAYADGHVKLVTPEEAKDLIWKP